MAKEQTPETTESIRVRKHTKAALCRVAYNPPFKCASLAEFLALCERGDMEAIAAWQCEAKELMDA
jgi:hypothetical protein